MLLFIAFLTQEENLTHYYTNRDTILETVKYGLFYFFKI